MYSPEELKAAGLDDFKVFLRHVWKHLGLPPPTKVQLDIAHWLQHGPNRAILQAFRGVGKSWITVAFVAWTLLHDPQKKILVVSAGETLANDITKFLLRIIREMPLLQHLEPKKGQRESAVSFDVGPATASKDPSVKSVGITGQITGGRADIIVADDIETPKNSYTHLLRERLSELVKEFDAVLKPLKSARILYLGTPQVEDSLYVKLTKRGYTTAIWPADIPDSVSRYSGRLAPLIARMMETMKPGEPVDPMRFSKEDLAERMLSYGAAGYALQFRLDTSPSDAEKHPLKLKDLIIHDCDDEIAPVKMSWSGEKEYVIQDLQAGGFDGDYYRRAFFKSPEMSTYTTTVMWIDPSGKGTDETAYAVVRELHGMLYLVDVGGYTDGFSEATLTALAGKAARWKVNKIVIEKNYGGGMFDELLRPKLISVRRNCIDEEFDTWSKTRKEDRIIDILSPVTQSHRLVVDRRVIESDLKKQQENSQYSFVQQFTRMSRVKDALPHDDRIEAVAGAVSYFTTRMAKDADKAVQKFREEAMKKELKEYLKHTLGGPRKLQNRWA